MTPGSVLNLLCVRSKYLRLLQYPSVSGRDLRSLCERERVFNFLSRPIDGGTLVKLVLSNFKVCSSTRDHNYT